MGGPGVDLFQRYCEPPPRSEGEVPPAPLPGAPVDLDVRWSAPLPMSWRESDLGVPVEASTGSAFRHRLVTVGDSLTHGFKSLAIHETNRSWPMIVAWELGLSADFDLSGATPEAQFTFPTYPGPDRCPGLPLNLEKLVRALEADVGDDSLQLHEVAMTHSTEETLRAVAQYWNEGDGAVPLPAATSYHHNLAVWGYDVRDALSKSRAWCAAAMQTHTTLLHRLTHLREDVQHALAHHLSASFAGERSAVRSLWGPDENATQVSAARALGNDGGIETLVVALGANNALGSVTSLKLRWSQDDFADLHAKDSYNVWAPAHFATEYDELVGEIKKVTAAHVILATVPHVTVAPLARGVGTKPYYSRYFPRYTRPWISDADFDPSHDDCLTGDEARAIDAAIDQYNYTIKRHVYDARREGGDWHVLDLCGLLDRLAYRRYLESPGSRPVGFVPYELPGPLAALSPRPDTRFFRSDVRGRTEGGLIALDGIHPTTVGYGILAQEVIWIMAAKLGVQFARRDGTARTGDIAVDFGRLIAQDTLITSPPRLLNEELATLRYVDKVVDIGKSLLRKL